MGDVGKVTTSSCSGGDVGLLGVVSSVATTRRRRARTPEPCALRVWFPCLAPTTHAIREAPSKRTTTRVYVPLSTFRNVKTTQLCEADARSINPISGGAQGGLAARRAQAQVGERAYQWRRECTGTASGRRLIRSSKASRWPIPQVSGEHMTGIPAPSEAPGSLARFCETCHPIGASHGRTRHLKRAFFVAFATRVKGSQERLLRCAYNAPFARFKFAVTAAENETL